MIVRLAERLKRRIGSCEQEPIRLHRRRIFILPTRAGVLFAAVVLLMLLGSLNYNNNLGLAFTFLLIGTALVAILHTYRNLTGLQIGGGHTTAVFAGGVAQFDLHVQASKPPDRVAIAFSNHGHGPNLYAVKAGPGVGAVVALSVPAPQRGILALGRCSVSTTYPLGLFRAWSWVHPCAHCIVYPRPETGPVPPAPPVAADSSANRRGSAGREDFHGLRAYRRGDSRRHLAWKAAPLGPEPYAKQFEGDSGGACWLDWTAVQHLDLEARLSRLCRWIVDSHAAGRRFGLSLPGLRIDLGNGDAHKRRCLEALATWDLPDGQPQAGAKP